MPTNPMNASATMPTAAPLPGHYYTDPQRFAHEQRHIFQQHWLCVGRAESFAEPGDYLLVEVGHESVLLLRDEHHRLRAFFNVCRHRGARLCTQEQGRFARTIQCPYHGWSYGLDGRLLTARSMQQVVGFDAAAHGLRPVAMAAWEGFLFLNFAADPPPCQQVYAPLQPRLAPWHLAGLNVAQTIEYTVSANWKLIMQNHLESYHWLALHPSWMAQGEDVLRPEQDSGPFLGGSVALYEPGAVPTGSAPTTPRRPPLGEVRSEDRRRVYLYALFPTMLLSLHADYVLVHMLFPETPDTTRVVCDWLFDPMTMAQPDFDPGDAVEFWDTTNLQNWQVLELVQRGMYSRAYTPGPAAPQEALSIAFANEYLGMMNAER